MDITSASQQFAVAEQKSVAYGRKQQLLSKPTSELRTDASPLSRAIAVQSTAPGASVQATPASKEQNDSASLQADDEQIFNAFQTVGMVKRILAQLKAHNKDWLQSVPSDITSAKSIDSFAFSAELSQQSVWLGTSQQQQSRDGQWLATEQWEFGYQAVQASLSAELTLNSGERISFALDFSMEVSWTRYSYTEQRLQDPLLVSMSGSPVQLSDASTEFDLLANGSTVKLPQLAAQQYYLAYDRNQDLQINNGVELFGPRTGNGFAELAEFDDNGNGFIDPSDDIWQYLYLWRPEQNLLSMKQAKLGAISIESIATTMPLYNRQQEHIAQLQRSGLAFTEDGKPALVQQIDLVV